MQVGLAQIGALQVRGFEIGALQLRSGKIGTGQPRTAEIGALQLGLDPEAEQHAHQVRPGELRSVQLVAEIGALQVGAGEVGAGERSGDGTDQDVAVVDMAQFVGEHAFEFFVIQ